jgi:hypothetical protein
VQHRSEPISPERSHDVRIDPRVSFEMIVLDFAEEVAERRGALSMKIFNKPATLRGLPLTPGGRRPIRMEHCFASVLSFASKLSWDGAWRGRYSA